MELGYARPSVTRQDLEHQLAALADHGIHQDRIYTDEQIGAAGDRPGFIALLGRARAGDNIVATTLDRLGSNLRERLTIVGNLREQSIGITTLHDPIPIDTTGDPMAAQFVELLALLAHMDRVFQRERAAHARQAATTGKPPGRPPKLTPDQITAAQASIDAGTPVDEVAAKAGVSRATLYRHLERKARGLGEGLSP